MSASLGEFQRSMAVLLPKHCDGQSYALESDTGTITITYEALPPVKLSALVAMPARPRDDPLFRRATKHPRRLHRPL